MASKEQQRMGGADSKISRKAFGVAYSILQQMGDPLGDNTAGRAGQGGGPTSQVPVPQCPSEASRAGLEIQARVQIVRQHPGDEAGLRSIREVNLQDRVQIHWQPAGP